MVESHNQPWLRSVNNLAAQSRLAVTGQIQLVHQARGQYLPRPGLIGGGHRFTGGIRHAVWERRGRSWHRVDIRQQRRGRRRVGGTGEELVDGDVTG